MTTASTPSIAFITGASRGIGLETARQLGRLGFIVVLGSRDARKAGDAAGTLRDEGLAAESLAGDIADPHDRQNIYETIDERHGKLDILVNNAGVWLETPSASHEDANRTSTVSEAVLRQTFDANFFAPVLLTQLLLPLIRRAPAGRIVNVSSIHGSLTMHSDQTSVIYDQKRFAYGGSKTALNAFTVQLAHELRDTPIKVNSLHPGWVRSEMGGPDAMLDLPEGSATSVRLATLPAEGPTGGFFYMEERLPW
jgi:NAD(P)-dependent dehydrogenase (short-subunit alcohol dehydrogenase family)